MQAPCIRARGRRMARDGRETADAVEAIVGEHQPRAGDGSRMQGASARPLGPAHFEDVREIRRQDDLESKLDGTQAVVRNREPLVAGALPQELRAEHVQQSLGPQAILVEGDVGIRQVDREQRRSHPAGSS